MIPAFPAPRQTSITPPRLGNLGWVAVWVGLGLLFGLVVLLTRGRVAAAEYYAAYFLEESLSLDNIFVFVIIFSQLRIPAQYQRRVLRFGIAGAVVLRAAMIVAGIAVVERFNWITYPFAVLILFAAWRMVFAVERQRAVVEAACNVCETWIAKVVRVTPVMHGQDFWHRSDGRLMATPLFVALVVIETADIVFALDSVPAVLAITRSPFIVYSSNVMAMLGLRSLYFVLADLLPRLTYLRPGLALLLAFTGTKMLTSAWLDIPAIVSVLAIVLVLVTTVIASVWFSKAAPGTTS